MSWRSGITKIKQQFPSRLNSYRGCGEVGLPCSLVINKTDKLKKREITQIVQEIGQILNDFHIEIKESSPKGLLKMFTVSAKNGVNMQELKLFVEKRFNLTEHC